MPRSTMYGQVPADHEVFLETSLLEGQVAVEADGTALMRRELGRVPDRSAIVLMNAGLTDLARHLKDAPELLRQKIRTVVIMGGVQNRVGAGGAVFADTAAFNNATDQRAADATYGDIQKNHIPLIVVSREAAYAAPVSPDFYEQLGRTGNPIGVALRDQQKQSLRNLWREVRGKPASGRLNAEWFVRTFADLRPDRAPRQVDPVKRVDVA